MARFNPPVRRIFWVPTLLVMVALAGVLMGFQLIQAQGTQSNVIYACVRDGVGIAKIVGPNETCPLNWTLREWNIQGPPGNDGADGDQGIQGDQGLQGVQGLQGDQGIQGVPETTEPSSIATLEARISSLEALIATLESSTAENDEHIMDNLDREVDFLLGFINELRAAVFPGSSQWTR